MKKKEIEVGELSYLLYIILYSVCVCVCVCVIRKAHYVYNLKIFKK